jgi:nucleoside-diphosphate-sugar epimerase
MFLKLGIDVSVSDITRVDECLRLSELEIMDQVEYIWRASQDLSPADLNGLDLIVDCAIGFPDRPFGTASPRTAISANIEPAVGLLESLRKLSDPPLVIYPSSFNSLYGNNGVYDENTPVNPTSVYGWTKAAVEQLYRTYHHSFGIPILITRVGSSYGEMMRTDELVAKVILANLQNQSFSLRSPYSKRLWTYVGDVVNSYEAIVKTSDYGHDSNFLRKVNSMNTVINVAGNVGDQILSNLEISKLIGEIMNSGASPKLHDFYEPGEIVDGKPVDFGINADLSRSLIAWEPEHTLREGLEKTVEWFTNKFGRVRMWNTE